MSRYPADGHWAMTPVALLPGQRIKLDSDKRWWTVQAVTDHFAAVVRQVPFEPAGTLCYSVLDWRNGVRGPCNLVGQGWGDGTYSTSECEQLLAGFESGDLEVSQRNWVRTIVNRVEGQP